MAAAGVMGPIGMFALVIICVLILILIFFYAGCVAYKGSKNRSSLALLVGASSSLLGIILYFVVFLIEINTVGTTAVVQWVFSIGLFLLSAGLLVTAVSVVLYVKEHNKLLNRELQK